MLRNLTLSLIALALLLVVQPRGSLGEAGANPVPSVRLWLDPAQATVVLGHTVTLQLVVEGATNLGAFEVDLVRDAAVAEVQEVRLGEFLGSSGRNTMLLGPDRRHPAWVTFAAFSYGHEPGPDGSGVLAWVTLRATGAGTTALTLQDIQITDTRANLVPATGRGATMTVVGPGDLRTYLPLIVRGGR